jgi:4-amino-4-deoxy-L-arabinose transferase-like glycosyltransferase
MNNPSYTKFSWLIIFAFALLKLFYSGTFPLVADEAYYWQWSRHLALGYHDHPPMLAWMISLATLFLGHSETAVRLPAVFSHTIAIVYLFLIAKRWMNARIAFYTVVLAQSILGFTAAGILATPDSPLIAGWAGAMYHIARGYDDGSSRHWLMGGAWFGVGMLGKYTMAIFPLLVLVPGLLYVKPRKQLTRLWPYAGLLLGILMFSPVLLWNIGNHWNTFRHVAHKGGVDQGWMLHSNYLVDFLASQAGLLSPLVFLLLLGIWFYPFGKSTEKEDWISKYLFFTSFPLVAVFTLLSLHTRVEGNWAAPGYLGAAILMTARIDALKQAASGPKPPSLPVRIWPWALVSSYLLTGLILVQVVWPIIPLPVKLDRIAKETEGWKRLGQSVHAMQQSMPHPEKTFVFALKYQTASELSFYTPGKPDTVAINRWTRPNAFEYWWNDADLVGWDAVGVGSASQKNTARLKQIFEHVSAPERLDIHRKKSLISVGADDAPVSAYFLYRAFGFKGGIKWMPKDMTDIRAEQP